MQTDSALGSLQAAGENIFTGLQHTIAQIDSATGVQHYASDLTYFDILISLSIAAILGALIAYHPRRNIELKGPVTDQELRKTQIVICVAGAVMVAIIEGSLERAFGLVGLGSFVRYRTALRNPYDLSVIFILIGLGMACGLQNYEFAVTITGFFYVLMFLLGIQDQTQQNLWTYTVQSANPDEIERAFQMVADESEIDVIKVKTDKELGLFIGKFTSHEVIDKDQFQEDIQNICGNDELFIRTDWEQTIKKR